MRAGWQFPASHPKTLPKFCNACGGPLDQALDEESVRLSARVCLVDAIKHGNTTLFDHHASPNFLSGSLDAIAQEVQKAGLRAVLCYETTDRYGEGKMRAALEENVAFIKRTKDAGRKTQGNSLGLVRGAFGLHAPLTVSTATLQASLAAIDGLETGIHIHVSESNDDWNAITTRNEGTPVEWLMQNNALNNKSIVAHAVHVDDYEIRLLQESEAWVSHQPRSNMNNAVGVAQVEAMLEAGVKVCLGNDGFSNGMWEDWKSAYLLHKIHHEDPRRMGGYSVAEMAIYNNAALANAYFPEAPLGTIQVGAVADLILVDYHAPTPLTPENLPWHIIFGFRDSMVTSTIVQGQFLMKDRQLLTMDEAEIAAHARDYAPKVWEAYNEKTKGE
jgi:putative selenium metabolism protein SsnA